MEYFTEALAAIKMVSEKILFVSFIFVFAVLLVLHLSISFYLAFIISVIFSLMVREDYISETIDLRYFAILLIALMFVSTNITLFITQCLFSLLFFSCLRLATTKIYTTRYISCTNKVNERLSHGYLYILAISIFVYLIASSYFYLPTPSILNQFYKSLNFAYESIYFVSFIVIVLLSATLYLHHKIAKARTNKKTVVYGFGDGDPLILAAFAGCFGFIELMNIFAISLLVSLFCYAIYFLKNKICIIKK